MNQLYVYIYPLPLELLSHPSSVTLPLVITEHWAELPVLHSSFPLANLHMVMGFPGGSDGTESTCNAGDLGSILGLGRSPGEGKGYPLQYSGLENSMDRIVHGVAKSGTWLSEFHSLHFKDIAIFSSTLGARMLYADKTTFSSTNVGWALTVWWALCQILWKPRSAK